MRFLIIALFFISTLSIAQNNDSVQIAKVAVYPNCDSNQSNTLLLDCIHKKMSKKLLRYMNLDFPVTHENVFKDSISVEIEFFVNVAGQIENARIENGDSALRVRVARAWNEYIRWFNKKKKKFIPAVDENGDNVKMEVVFPIILINPYAMPERKAMKARLNQINN